MPFAQMTTTGSPSVLGVLPVVSNAQAGPRPCYARDYGGQVPTVTAPVVAIAYVQTVAERKYDPKD